MGEQGEAHFDYVVMLALCCSILLMRVWARDVMGDAYTLKEGCKFLVLPSLDGLNVSYPVPRKRERSLHTCAQDVQITRMVII
jgi:hypothetical protein